MVSILASTVCGPPLIRRDLLTQQVCLEWKVIPSPSMEALMQHYKTAGFSREVSRLATAPRRPSISGMYTYRWLRFANWATGHGFDPLGPTAAQITAFLYELLILKAISDMIMSVELQRPRLTPALLQWDLGIVLEAQSKSPYEPLREASLKH